MRILNKRKTVAVLLLISLILSMLPCKDLAAKKENEDEIQQDQDYDEGQRRQVPENQK